MVFIWRETLAQIILKNMCMRIYTNLCTNWLSNIFKVEHALFIILKIEVIYADMNRDCNVQNFKKLINNS
jgi:hypothetical protein